MNNKEDFNQKLEAALYYAQLGYKVLPCVANGKRPAIKKWTKNATTDENQIRQWWKDNPDYNIGVYTGGFLVVDIDGKKNPWPTGLDQKSDLSQGVVSLTPNGKHFLFQEPEGRKWKSTTSKLAEKVDTRARGGYIIAPPSTVKGNSYQWVESELTERPEELPEPPQWLVEQLDQHCSSKSSSTKDDNWSTSDGTNPDREFIPEGRRNADLSSIAGSLRRSGLNEKEILVALLEINKNRCNPPCEKNEVERIANSISRYEPDQVMEIMHFGLEEEPVKSKKIRNPGKMPKSLFKVPGLIGDIVNHNLKTAYKSQPELALGAALALMGTITGRKVRDYRDTRTNIYCLGVCDSGGGKEHARQLNKEILQMAGADNLIGPEGFASHAGIVTAVDVQPSILFQTDEIGRVIKTLNKPGKSPHLYNISTVLMKMYSSSNSIYVGDAYADIKNVKKIIQPNPCLYGTTVPESLYEGLSADSITNGFLSRMMIFESGNHDPEPVQAEIRNVPEKIITKVKYWIDLSYGGNLSGQYPQPITVSHTAKALEMIGDFEKSCREERKKLKGPLGRLWTRTNEKAHKLALLFACSVDPMAPEITAEAVDWSIKLSLYLTHKMVYIASQWISETPYEANKKRLLRALESVGKSGMSKTQLAREIQYLKAKERDEIITDLLSTGYIEEKQVTSKSGKGAKATRYTIT